MNRTLFSVLLAGACFLPIPALAEAPAEAPAQAAGEAPPSEPIYVRLDNAWVGLYARGNQYVEYPLVGKEVKLQDANHILLNPSLGLMVTFADKSQFGQEGDMLEAHRQWEIEYWRKEAGEVESKNRDDLAGGRSDLKVTEITVPREKGAQFKAYLIGLAMNDGVFVFAISPAEAKIDPMVKKLIASIRLVNQRLDIKAEAKRLVEESDAKR